MASGHQIIALIGGATGHIGDPSGKADERKLLGNSEVTENSKSIKSQLDLMIANGREYLKRKGLETNHRDYKTLNNLDWFKEVTLLDFLATTGRFSRVSAMVKSVSYSIACSRFS
jgi:tyrosyl-tRNA synthetase